MPNPKCFQCGDTGVVLNDAQSEWLHCGRCGERVIRVAELREQAERAEEERIRDALGVRNFKPSR